MADRMGRGDAEPEAELTDSRPNSGHKTRVAEYEAFRPPRRLKNPGRWADKIVQQRSPEPGLSDHLSHTRP